jgi:uncharacterized protein YbaA (DUF1428 family)
MAAAGRDMWIKNGALQYFECMGNNLEPQAISRMEGLGFPKMTNAKSDETVWFSFIIYKSKENRDEVNKKVTKEMDEKYKDQKDFQMPFDMKRTVHGGFSVEVEG